MAVNILNEMLTYDKINAGMVTLERQLVRAVTLVNNSVKMYMLPAKRKSVNLLTPQVEKEGNT